jgi:hypothetical protein
MTFKRLLILNIISIVLVISLCSCTDVIQKKYKRNIINNDINFHHHNLPGLYAEHRHNGYKNEIIREGDDYDEESPFYRLLIIRPKEPGKFYMTRFAYMCKDVMMIDNLYGYHFIGVDVSTYYKSDIYELVDGLKEGFGGKTHERYYLCYKHMYYGDKRSSYIILRKDAITCFLTFEESVNWMYHHPETVFVPAKYKVR